MGSAGKDAEGGDAVGRIQQAPPPFLFTIAPCLRKSSIVYGYPDTDDAGPALRTESETDTHSHPPSPTHTTRPDLIKLWARNHFLIFNRLELDTVLSDFQRDSVVNLIQ